MARFFPNSPRVYFTSLEELTLLMKLHLRKCFKPGLQCFLNHTQYHHPGRQKETVPDFPGYPFL